MFLPLVGSLFIIAQVCLKYFQIKQISSFYLFQPIKFIQARKMVRR
jgi:hypothetical protein